MRTVEQVSEWDSVPFDGGYDGLRALADREFSGAVVSGSTQLFMLNGRTVGILDGDLDTFENADGTARQAPHDALPLLAVMQARADEPRAQYYTEDTPISEVDRTLTDGKFTGYVELSENVLSGDYYLVYHQGRSMSVAWVGSAQRLATDEDAFEQADGEVGIYQVIPADIEPIELPEPELDDSPAGAAFEDEASATDAPEAGAEGTDTTSAATPDEHEATADADDEFTEPALERSAGTGDTDGSAEEGNDRGSAAAPSGPPGSKAAGASQGRAVDPGQSVSERSTSEAEEQSVESVERAETTTEPDRETSAEQNHERTAGGPDTESAIPEAVKPDADRTAQESAEADIGQSEPTGPDATPAEPTSTQSESAATHPDRSDEYDTGRAPDEPDRPDPQATKSREESPRTAASSESEAAATALETRSIPSLDPGWSSSDTDTTSAHTPEPPGQPGQEVEPTADEQPLQATTEPAETEPATTETTRSGGQRSETAELAAELDERADQIQQLESELRTLSAENEDLAADKEELVAERNRLQNELADARAEIQRLEEQLEAAELPAAGGVQLSAKEAIDGTNLFVRYHSKGGATLAEAQDGSADRSAVEENLRLEYHTQFDADEAVVDGVEFETFLQESIHYRFVDWLVRTLLYEIRDTGHANAMSVLYGALPAVDRAELNGNISVAYTENGQENREQERFDVVVRDRMGNPLVVANINDSRQPATNGQMTDIVQTAERVGNSSGSLAAAFLVTSSFFEPEALETAEEATSSGLFSRDKNKSFVNLSRKDGYHLCLLEARNNEFHLAVPEL